MELRTALIRYNVAFWAMLIVMFVAQILAGLGPVVSFYVYAPMTFIFVVIITFVVFGSKPSQPPPEENNERIEEARNDLPIVRQARIDWLDNLKVFLISLVVVGHSAVAIVGFGAFLTLGTAESEIDNTEVVPDNQIELPTYWYNAVFWSGFVLLKPAIVPLFFFVSGYFSAASRIKHGPGKFLKRTFSRLFPPAFLFWLVMNPLNAYLGYALAQPVGGSWSYSPGQAATWFLTWLMVFNCCYALVDDAEIKGSNAEIPKFGRIIKVGIITALLQGVAGTLCILSGGSFAEMPCFLIGDGYFNALGYACGILARTHNWLSDYDQGDLVKKAKRYTIVVAVVTVVICFLCYAPGAPLNTIGESPLGVLLLSVVLFLPIGPYCPLIWIVMLDFFRGKLTLSEPDSQPDGEDAPELPKKRTFQKFMSGAAFAVYLFHYFFVTLYTYLFVEILNSSQGMGIMFIDSPTTVNESLSDGNKFAGFFFVASLSLVSVFPFGGVLKMIPIVGEYI